jgi:ABC-type phosphate/phosphonate transport system substrate-binding protein
LGFYFIFDKYVMMKFSDWIQARETTASQRTRQAAALGLGPLIPAAAIHSHSTAPPWQVKAILKKLKKLKKSRKKKVNQ